MPLHERLVFRYMSMLFFGVGGRRVVGLNLVHGVYVTHQSLVLGALYGRSAERFLIILSAQLQPILRGVGVPNGAWLKLCYICGFSSAYVRACLQTTIAPIETRMHFESCPFRKLVCAVLNGKVTEAFACIEIGFGR